jgi:thioredoxin 1
VLDNGGERGHFFPVKELTDDNFDGQMAAGGIALVDFFAPWCGPCRAFEPVFQALEKEFGGRVTLGKVNIDASPDLAARCGVRSIPTLIFFRDGVAIETLVGARTGEDLAKRLRTLLQA